MKVKNIMTRKVIAVDQETKIIEIARLLSENKLTGLPVIEKNKQVVGIITEADLITRDTRIHIPSYVKFLDKFVYIKKGKDVKMSEQCKKIINVNAKDLMTKNPICVSPELPIKKLAEVFTKERINPIPVVKNNKLVGIVSRSDLVKLFI